MGQAGTVTIRVLMIEDNPADAATLRVDLQHTATAAFDLQTARTLADGLDRLKAERFDVLLLDLGLPDSKAHETIRRVTEAVPDLPVVVLTVSDDEALGTEAVDHGVQDYFVKGTVCRRLLARAIRYAIYRKRIEADLRDLTAALEQRVRERTAELKETVQALSEEVAEHRRSLKELRETLGISASQTTPDDGTRKAG